MKIKIPSKIYRKKLINLLNSLINYMKVILVKNNNNYSNKLKTSLVNSIIRFNFIFKKTLVFSNINLLMILMTKMIKLVPN